MPAGYAHMLACDQASMAFIGQDSIEEELRGHCRDNPNFIHLGSVSPDYPYLNLIHQEQGHWADHMHYEFTGDILKSMAQRLLDIAAANGTAGKEFMIPFCWTLGYISHVTADLVVHPVVYDIVGSYKGHEDRHRECEMIQDSYIYNKLTGDDIEHSGLLAGMRECSDPDDEDKIDPVLRTFWVEMLQRHFAHDFEINPPDIDHWHERYLRLVGFSGNPLFIGRILDPGHSFTYKPSSDISAIDRRMYLDSIRLPDGRFGTYLDDVFPKAVSSVAQKWILLGEGITRMNIDNFLSAVVNSDLDSGFEMTRHSYW